MTNNIETNGAHLKRSTKIHGHVFVFEAEGNGWTDDYADWLIALGELNKKPDLMESYLKEVEAAR